MTDTQNVLLQITDETTGRHYVVRIRPEEQDTPTSHMLDLYMKHPDLAVLKQELRITDTSAEILTSLQDLVFNCTDQGTLGDMVYGIEFRQKDRPLSLEAVPEAEPVWLSGTPTLLIDLVVDRTNVRYDRNWTGFSRRRWNLHPVLYSDFVESCLPDPDIMRLDTTEKKLTLVEALAKRIWKSDFENYSRFLGFRWVYKTGDETVRNIINGGGGICSEKVQALKFLTDHYGLKSEYVLAGANVPDPAPESKLRELLTTFDFRFAKRQMRYWQHTALLYEIDGNSVLVDATNGNIPFLFLENDDAYRLLGCDPKSPLKVTMAVQEEDFYYHKISQDIPKMLFFAMEGWISHIDLIQVLDNELGLYIADDFMVTPIVYRTDVLYDKLRTEYSRLCDASRLEYTISQDWAFESPLARRFSDVHPEVASKVLRCKDYFLHRYDDCHGSGHEAGLVLISLHRQP